MDEQDRVVPAGQRSPDGDQRDPWLRATLAGLDDGSIVTDATGRINFLNPAAQAITGWTLEQVRGAPLDARLQLLDTDTRQPLMRTALDALRAGTSIALPRSALIAGKDARERSVVCTFIPVRNAHDEITGLVILLREAANGALAAAERKRAQAALEHSENRYRRLFETAKDGILILDAGTGRIIDANPYLSDLLGYPLDELHGKELWEIGFFKDRQANQNAYSELRRTGYPLRRPALAKQGRRSCGGRVRKQRLPRGRQRGRSMQYPRYYRAQPTGAANAGAGAGIGGTEPSQG